MRVREVMTTQVITVQPDTTVEEIARLLTTHRISGVPVVDKDNRVVGIVTHSDLFLKEKGIPFSAVKLPTLFKEWVDPAKFTEIIENARHHKAEDIMTRKVVTVGTEDDVGKVARLLTENRFKRVPVVQDGKLVGIVSRSDLIRLLAK